jgi:protein-disulfide isomerase
MRSFLSLAVVALLSAACAQAQFSAPSPSTKVNDSSALHPPAGARVAIVEFADLECPACALANPYLKDAAAKYKIPWIRHDYLIPNHIWSKQAAINARWFDTKIKGLGEEYRNNVFASQSSIYSLLVLRQFTDKFAKDHHIDLPFAIDPQGKLEAAVKADSDLGTRMGVHQTPTIWIVTANSKGAPYIEVQRADSQLYQIIDQALADIAGPLKSSGVKKVAAPKAATAAKKPAAQ